MSETLLIPKKINIKTKPYGQGDELFISVEAENMTEFVQTFSCFVTRELCSIIIQFLERAKFMKCVFEGDQLILIKNRLPKMIKSIGQSQNISGFEGVPIGTTLYSCRSGENLFAYVRVGDWTLSGYVSTDWADVVVEGIMNKTKLIFNVEADKKGRETFKTILGGQDPPRISTDKTLPHIAYFDQ